MAAIDRTKAFTLNKLSTLSDSVFPGIVNIWNNDRKYGFPDKEILSCLPLQMSLYFNVFYFPLWIINSSVILSLKYKHLSELYSIILITTLVVISLIEVLRLYLGYSGNLTDKVPELAGFWLLTCLLQFPLLSFLLFNEDALILPFERSLNIVMMLFIVFEMICGYAAIKSLTKHQVIKFHMNNSDNVQEVPSHHEHSD